MENLKLLKKDVTVPTDNSKLISSFAPVKITSILNANELSELKKSKEFKEIIGNEQIMEKSELIHKFISFAISKANLYNEKILAKCLTWVNKELEENLDIKPDAKCYENLEQIRKAQPNLEGTFGWMELFSAINKQKDLLKVANKFTSKLKNLVKKRHNKYSKEKSVTETQKILGSRIETIDENLLNLDSPEFNIFELEKNVGPANILPVVATYALSSFNLLDSINNENYPNFIYKVAQEYHRENPYHTDLHAADMCQSLLLYILKGDIQTTLNLNSLDLLSLFISAAIHDCAHPGLNSNYLTRAKDYLAIIYNDQSVLENFHLAKGWNIILNGRNCNIFDKLSEDDFDYCRKRIVQCVLSTDMTNHNKHCQSLKSKIEKYNIKNGENIDKVFEDLDPISNFNAKQLFLNILIHSADIANPTKPLELTKIWADKCNEEFFRQGDLERAIGMKISFGCDRNNVSVAKSQIGFIDAIVHPLFSMVNECFPKINFTLENMAKTKEYYLAELEKEKSDDNQNKN